MRKLFIFMLLTVVSIFFIGCSETNNNIEEGDLIIKETRTDLAGNKLVLIARDSSSFAPYDG